MRRRAASPGEANRSKITTLEIERDLLAKAIARLHDHYDGMTADQRGRLLARYRSQLGGVVGEIEWLRTAGPESAGGRAQSEVEQKLSSIEEKINEMSAVISRAGGAKRQEPVAARRTEVPEILLPDIEIDDKPGSRHAQRPRRRARQAAPAAGGAAPDGAAARREGAQVAVSEARSEVSEQRARTARQKRVRTGADAAQAKAPDAAAHTGGSEPSGGSEQGGAGMAEMDEIESIKRELARTLSKLEYEVE